MLNIVAEWKFDEASGIAANDSWGGRSNGALVGFTNTTAGYGDSSANITGWMSSSSCVSGTCLEFDSSVAAYVDCGAETNLNITSAATISVWAKKNYILSTLFKGILGKHQVVGGGTLSYRIGAYGDRVLVTTLGLTDSSIESPAGSYDSTEWTHIAFVYSGSYKYIYINGVSLVSEPATGSINTSVKKLIIGGDGDGGGGSESGNRFSGLIDDVRIYNVAMSTSQIKEQYYVGLNKLLINGAISSGEYAERVEAAKLSIK
ncbi:MAG: LamG domain-containing protein [Candidatus Pacearchaeota archaeon]